MPAEQANLIVVERHADGTNLLTVDGVLDSTTYLPLRDAIIKAAMDNPRAVIIDVTGERNGRVPIAWPPRLGGEIVDADHVIIARRRQARPFEVPTLNVVALLWTTVRLVYCAPGTNRAALPVKS